MNFLARRAFSVMALIGAIALTVAYANGTIFSDGEGGPRFGRQPAESSPASASSPANNLNTSLSDTTAEQLRSHGFRLVEPTGRTSFELPSTDGTIESVDQYRGKVIVLNFWATWCPPCQKEMPSMERLWQEYRDDDLVVLALDMDEPASKVRSFVESFELSFPVWIDDRSVANSMNVSALPTTWLISPKGQPLAELRGPLHWDQPSVKQALEGVMEDTRTDSSTDAVKEEE